MKVFFTFFLLIGCIIIPYAQDSNDDLEKFNELMSAKPVSGEKDANLKFYELLTLSKQLNLPRKEREIKSLIMLDHYYFKRKDSCLFYLKELKKIAGNSKDSISAEEKIELYPDIAFIESAFFGYSIDVTNYYGEAYELALIAEDDYSIFHILVDVADLLLLQEGKDMGQVNQLIINLENTLEKYPDTYFKFASYNALAELYFLKDDLDIAKNWVDKTLAGAPEDEVQKYDHWFAENLLSYFYYKKGEVYKALDALNATMKNFTPKNEDEKTYTYYFYFLYYKYVDEEDKALSYITKASESTLSIHEKIYYKDKMVQYLYKQEKTALAKKANKEKLQLLSTITSPDDQVISRFFINELEKKNLEVTKKSLLNKNLKLEQQSAERKTQLTIVIKVLILVLLGIILYLVRKKLKKKDETIISLRHREAEILSDLVTQRENELQLIVIKLSNRMMMLKGVKDTLDNIKERTPELNTLKTKINQLIATGAELTEVSDRLQTQYPGIYSNLKESHPELSETEIKYCLLTKLNLSLKETASILMVSPDTVKHSRSRIKRKMKIPKEITLKEYMDQISNEKRVVA